MHLNYHHLRHFRAVAKEGNLTRAAQKLGVAQSALSTQIRQLEDQLGQRVFERAGRALRLTEAGQVVLGYAEEIFTSGAALMATFSAGPSRSQVLRLGAVATLSRNFQESFIAPLLNQPDVTLRLVSGSLDDLLGRLESNALDAVLTNTPVPRDKQRGWRCRRIARQEVSLVGQPRARPFCFPDDLAKVSLLLPTSGNEIRTGFDAFCDEMDLKVQVAAEVDDMAMMRLLARDTQAVALVPSVVVRDELRNGTLQEYCVVPDLYETFYAVTVERQFAHPLVQELLKRNPLELLAMRPVDGPTRPARLAP